LESSGPPRARPEAARPAVVDALAAEVGDGARVQIGLERGATASLPTVLSGIDEEDRVP
jgi:hypothetical protein